MSDLGGSLQVAFDYQSAKTIMPYLFRERCTCDCNDQYCPHKSAINPIAMSMLCKYVMNIDLVTYLQQRDWSSMEPEFYEDLASKNWVNPY